MIFEIAFMNTKVKLNEIFPFRDKKNSSFYSWFGLVQKFRKALGIGKD